MTSKTLARFQCSRIRLLRALLLLVSTSSLLIVLKQTNLLAYEAERNLNWTQYWEGRQIVDRMGYQSSKKRMIQEAHNQTDPVLRDGTSSDSCQRKRVTSDGNKFDARKLILFWNKLETFSYYGFHGDQFDFDGICGGDCCRTSARLTSFAEADAVIFTIKDVKSWNGFPKDRQIKRSDVVGFPKHAHSNQVFVLFHIEAPARFTRLRWDAYNRIFNLTYTYLSHPDTDIHVRYGRILPRPTDNPYTMPNSSVLAKKTNLVAWAVSNCYPSNVRNEYVRKLQKYISVDIYGKCGSMNLNCTFKQEGCFDVIAGRYMFFLAFENSHCQEYVTEKMYRTLTMDLIPIVMGGADYRSRFPPHSYIDAKEFKSPERLAKYLLKLANDTRKYLSYFDWKKTLVSDNVHDAAHNLGLCKLCDILHDPDYVYKSPYFDYRSYYSPKKYCLSRAHQKRLFGL
ncbi:hypothetical protein LSH36_53g03010 [Paralvinella palmiformis]|uniref:Fucosyltransferase n=1 Tax=Paralvinella palmiformis TaxID=53620 RepID=A0AAD9K6A8_9ANNE|nr:hypothetical protein LSH36_53g03010 [Paralvinella palmiformis]